MNDMRDHPITRVRVLDRLRGLRRSARKMRDKLRRTGPMTNEERHALYGHAEKLVTYTDEAIRLLDEARPVKAKRK